MSAAPVAEDPRPRWRRLLPSTARTQIIAWVLLLVLAALGVVTFVTWRLLVRATDARMDSALRFEVQEFTELTEPGVNPRTGEPFSGVEEVIREAIAYNIARPNEKFLGYVDGRYRTQSRQEPGTPEVLAHDAAFAERVATVTEPAQGRYQSDEVGEVRYLAIPVGLNGDPARGVIVAAYLGDAERESANDAARLMLIVGVGDDARRRGRRVAAGGPDPAPAARRRGHHPDDHRHRLVQAGAVVGQRRRAGPPRHTINGMLDRVEGGVSAQRRFIDDAGHELRTPITIVRGHLEVVDPRDPQDVTSTVALVDDELVRMNRMVSDLLLLAHSEQPSFLHPDVVDVGALTQEAFEKVTRLAERDFELETVARVVAVLDPQRITQALVALADNACRFTEDGGWIGVGSQLSGGWLRFWVSDSGPGVTDEDRARIFERFARGGGGVLTVRGLGFRLSGRSRWLTAARCFWTACVAGARRSPSQFRRYRRNNGACPDRGGRAADRLVHRERVVRQRLCRHCGGGRSVGV